MKCFYHNDADGRCAAFWVRMSNGFYTGSNFDICDFIEMNYSKRFPIEIIQKHERVYIVDYSISPDEMRDLLKITTDVIWIDHHKTAIEKYEGFEYPIPGIRYDGLAACMLTYCYFYHMTVNGFGKSKPFDVLMTQDAPLFTCLIADWDVWKFDYGDDTRKFITAFNAYDFSPESNEWLKFFDNGVHENMMITQGEMMLKFRDGWAKDYMKLGFEAEFEGHRCFAVNLGHCNSEYFKSLTDGIYDILIPFVFDGSLYTVSLYSTYVDVSEIAKKYGGGGHIKAAGFQCLELPFKKKDDAAE